jgi:hypothetical protein
MAKTIWFKCERPFVPPKDLPCHSERFEALEVIEYRSENPARPYGLKMQTEVNWRNEVSPTRMAAIKLAGELNLIWAYVAGRSLFYKVLHVTPITAPPGWESNSDALEKTLPSKGGFAEFKWTKSGSSGTPLFFMPLEHALIAVRAYRCADEATKRLIRLHYDAMSHLGSESTFLLLSKALELTAALLPGRTRPQKQQSLPSEFGSELRHSLQWLFDIANTRQETRHVVERGRMDLHPKLTKEEREDFRHDAELVVRGAIGSRLGVQHVFVVD